MDIKNFVLKGDWERGSYYKQNTIVVYNNEQYLVVNPCQFQSSIEPDKDDFNYEPCVNKDTKEIKTIQEQVIENLEEEIKSLSQVIIKTRENREYSMYKNLIISLKEVLELYNNEINKDKNIINSVINVHIDSNVKSGEELIETLKNIPNTLVKDSKGNCQFSY